MHLVRENPIDVMLSYAIAKENKRFVSEKLVENNKVQLDAQLFKKDVKKQDFKVNLARIILSILPNPVLNVTYDDLCQDKDRILDLIVEFLGVESVAETRTLESNLKKINQKSHQEVIENYAEIKELFQGTKFAQYLN